MNTYSLIALLALALGVAANPVQLNQLDNRATCGNINQPCSNTLKCCGSSLLCQSSVSLILLHKTIVECACANGRGSRRFAVVLNKPSDAPGRTIGSDTMSVIR
jgi:hypothetical protein